MTCLCFLGDVWLSSPVKCNVTFPGGVIFNLEAPITKSRRPAPGKINLKAEKNWIPHTFGQTPLAACLANNHTMDYGEDGFHETLASLEENGIKHFGAGSLEENCNNPLISQVGGLKVALMGYVAEDTIPITASERNQGPMAMDLERMLADIDTARKAEADRIIVSIHWGDEEVYLPRTDAIRTAHRLIEGGADLIIGHHAHRIQPYEVYRGKYIFYGLGNCLFHEPEVPFPSYFDEAGQPTRMYRGRLHHWNHLSLAVFFELETGCVEVSVLKGDNTALNLTRQNAKRHLTEFSSLEGHDRRFRRSRVLGKLKTSLSSYLSHPKVPRLRHLRSILRLLSRRDDLY
ncbi:MAG: CapA family protein [Candidatus Nealsonbacteria bacterium]|nr:CapA family protein [Candidatus Nealsonbacteria bacterium]